MAASAISIVLDPSEVATDRTELDINSGAIRIANDGPDWGDAAIAAALADRKFGSVPVGYRIPNRIVTIPLIVRAVSGTTFNQAQTKLQQKVARFQDEGGWLKRVSSNGTTKLYADIVDATLTFPDPRFQDVEGSVVLTLECLPDFYGDEAAGIGSTASSGDNDSLVFTEPNIPGDYPARSRYTFTDTGSQARQAVLIASQSRTYDSAATAALAYEAEDLTPLDAAAVVTKTGAHGGASNNAVHHAAISPSWTGVLSTQHASLGHLTHWGNYRIIARVYTSATTRARFEYSVGDSATRRVNAAVTVPGDGGFYLCDFGEVRISKPPLGTQQWMGAFFAQADTAGVTFGIDKVWLAPTESLSVCRPRQSSSVGISSLPLSTDARDSFSQTSGSLNAKTADRGGAWSTAGATTDFTIDTTNGRAQRTATSDASQRFGVVGSNVTSCYAAVDIISSVFTTYYWQGLALRYVDTSNWIAAALYYFNSENRLIVVQSVAGVTTTLLEETIAAQAPGGSKRIAATVDPNGRVEVLFDGATYSVVCMAAATGGALASGKVGIVDYHPSATATTRQWDNFVGTSITTDVACLSGKSLSARHDGAWRETSSSGIYAPAHVEGSYPRALASGLESRTCRTLVLPSAGDFDGTPDTDPLSFSVRSYHRPAFLFAPEE